MKMFSPLKYSKILITAILVISIGSYLFVFFKQQNLIEEVSNDIENDMIGGQKSENLFPKRLNGELVKEENRNLYPVAVMIENHTDARPQSSLSKADVIYEALAEGEITRFLAIYDLSFPINKIGPVRSARPYYIDLAKEYGGLYAHCGGSDEALEELKNTSKIYDLNQYFRDKYFWRSGDRVAPHNLYTSSGLLAQALADASSLNNAGSYRPWRFREKELVGSSTDNFMIKFSKIPNYHVQWKYDPRKNQFVRWQNYQPHKDDDGSLIVAKNVIVQLASTKLVDRDGRRAIDLDAGGTAFILIGGQKIDGKWKKEAGRTIFYDVDGQEVEFNRGKIWVEIVPDKSYLSF